MTEAAVGIDGVGPLLEELPFGPVLLVVASLDLEDQLRPVREPDQEVWNVLPYPALVGVEDLETEVVVLGHATTSGLWFSSNAALASHLLSHTAQLLIPAEIAKR
jgi:hypothetical protein